MGSFSSRKSKDRSEAQTPATEFISVSEEKISSFYCAVCLEVLQRPMRTECKHVFCHACIVGSLTNNGHTCPYCRAYLSHEGQPATDIMEKMGKVHQNCKECEAKVCLSNMRSHTRTCQKYQETYGTAEEPVDIVFTIPATMRYSCPYCQQYFDEDGLVDHCLTHHRLESRLKICPICASLPSGDRTYTSRNFIRHLELRHTLQYRHNSEEQMQLEQALEESLLEYFRSLSSTSS